MTIFSQNGYPAQNVPLHNWQLPQAKRNFNLRHGSAGFLLMHYALWHHQNIHPLNKKGEPWDEWAWAFRDIRGATEVSNHSSGTAIDLNATRNPLGTTLMSAIKKARIRRKLLQYRGCIRWGGDYNGRKDEMHFEIVKSIEMCEKRARKLMKTKRGKAILQFNSSQRAVINS